MMFFRSFFPPASCTENEILEVMKFYGKSREWATEMLRSVSDEDREENLRIFEKVEREMETEIENYLNSSRIIFRPKVKEIPLDEIKSTIKTATRERAIKLLLGETE